MPLSITAKRMDKWKIAGRWMEGGKTVLQEEEKGREE